MNEQRRQHLPIGYWLKRADELLTAHIDAVQRDNGLSRLDWQALNVVRDADSARLDDVAGTLRPFAEAAAVSDVLDLLERRGLVHKQASGGYELTDSGLELHEKALAAQKKARLRAASGISEDEYRTAVLVLQRLVENLERDSAA